MNPRSDAVGLKLIVVYKLLKAIIGIAFCIAVLWLVSAGLAKHLLTIATQIRHHVVEAWSVALAEKLMRAATARNLYVVAVASALDGGVSLLEGWALHRRFRWSGWLIVATTASFIPLEAIALMRHVSVVRIALLLVNATIVIYLFHRRNSFAKNVPDETDAPAAQT